MGTLSGDEPTSGEFFLDNTRAVPVARATVRSVVTPATEPAPAPPDESRRERRRRLGVQRRITVRVILFILLVAAIPVGAFFAIRWYAYDNWFLTVQHNEIVIQQGHPGGVLWFHPKVVDRTGVHTSKLPSSGVSEIHSGVQEPSLAAAKSYVANLQSEYAASVKAGKSTTSTTSTSGVSGTPGAASSVPPANASTTTTSERRCRRRPPHERRGVVGRRIRWLGMVMLLCFALVVIQLANIQFRQASALANSPNNPRVAVLRFDNQRGTITAADGTVLAKSVKINSSSSTYNYQREYPDGPLFAGITGYDSPYYGTSGIEFEYNQDLKLHAQSPQNLSQVLFDKPPSEPDNVALTVDPALQEAATNALAAVPSANKDGAVVVLNPSTGAVLAMASNPTFDPNALSDPNVANEQKYDAASSVKDTEGFSGLTPIATEERFFPGSTFKVVTTTAVYNLAPSLINYDFPPAVSISFPDSDKTLSNDGFTPCGGTMATMLPQSCDPGYGELGIKVGSVNLTKEAELFGFSVFGAKNPTVPGIDLPDVVPSTITALAPTAAGRPGLQRDRPARRPGDPAAERAGGGRDRRRRGGHDPPPDVAGHQRPGGGRADLHAEADVHGGHPFRGGGDHQTDAERGRRRDGGRGIPTLVAHGRKDRNGAGPGADRARGDRRLDDRLPAGHRRCTTAGDRRGGPLPGLLAHRRRDRRPRRPTGGTGLPQPDWSAKMMPRGCRHSERAA